MCIKGRSKAVSYYKVRRFHRLISVVEVGVLPFFGSKASLIFDVYFEHPTFQGVHYNCVHTDGDTRGLINLHNHRFLFSGQQ